MVYNPVLIAGAAAWAAAQVLKVIINAIKGNGFMPERFLVPEACPARILPQYARLQRRRSGYAEEIRLYLHWQL